MLFEPVFLVVPLAYLGLGSNLGDRHAHLRAAVDGLREEEAIDVRAGSPIYETEAHTIDPEDRQPAFLNAVVEAAVQCGPERFLEVAQRLEARAGRATERDQWAPRPLDVDLLAVGRETRATDDLTVPHPRLAERRFVLRPWADLAPNFMVPAPFEAPVRILLKRCSDAATIRRVRLSLSANDSA